MTMSPVDVLCNSSRRTSSDWTSLARVMLPVGHNRALSSDFRNSNASGMPVEVRSVIQRRSTGDMEEKKRESIVLIGITKLNLSYRPSHS